MKVNLFRYLHNEEFGLKTRVKEGPILITQIVIVSGGGKYKGTRFRRLETYSNPYLIPFQSIGVSDSGEGVRGDPQVTTNGNR